MGSSSDDTNGLIERARGGDPLAKAAMLDGHRDCLRRLVARRLDRRLAPRVDPSDVIQEALADASRRLSDYLQNPPLPLLPWLYQFALERLAKLHRHHVRTTKRSVDRERPRSGWFRGPWRTTGGDLADSGTSPSGQVIRDEQCERVRAAMFKLSDGDRKVLAMRYFEAFSIAQIATALGISEGAAKVRHIRALKRVQTYLEDSR